MIRERGERVAAWATATLVVAVLTALTGTAAVLVRAQESFPASAEMAAGSGSRNVFAAPATPSSDPLRVRIPAIGVNVALKRLGLNDDATLEVPGYDEAGWYAGGPRPGEHGPALIAAHRDSAVGPAVFYRLEDLAPGDLVHIDYEEGSVTFAVRASQSFPKSQFPTERVYGATSGPALRLVTCDGTFDRIVHSYRDNLIVWADPAGPASPGQ